MNLINALNVQKVELDQMVILMYLNVIVKLAIMIIMNKNVLIVIHINILQSLIIVIPNVEIRLFNGMNNVMMVILNPEMVVINVIYLIINV